MQKFPACGQADSYWELAAAALINIHNDPGAAEQATHQLSQSLMQLSVQAVAGQSSDVSAFVAGSEAFATDALEISSTGGFTTSSTGEVAAARAALTRDCGFDGGSSSSSQNVTTATATVTAAPSTTVPSTSTGPSPVGLRPCDQNISANTDTSCDFASNTFYEYWRATGGDPTPGEESVEVWSSETQQSYTQICTNDGNEIDCTHNNGDETQFSPASVMAYTRPEANAYAASGNLGP